MMTGHPRCAMFLDMGLGKTVSTLTAFADLQDSLDVRRALVIAPLSVAQNTWTAEAEKWDHLNGLRVVPVLGSEKARRAALATDSDVYVINRENTCWLCAEMKNDLKSKFDMIIIDESSSFKSAGSKRFKALRKSLSGVGHIVLLTGTPNPNGYEDLWSQYCLLDGGLRLERTMSAYRSKYFHAAFVLDNGVVAKYQLNKGADKIIAKRVSDITISMKAEDYLSLPEAVTIPVTVSFDEALKRKYAEFSRDMVLPADGETIEALTAASLAGKLQQFTSGAVYDEEHVAYHIHDLKVDALADVLEAAKESGERVLVYYQFRSELERLLDAFPDAVTFKGEPDVLRDWNAGRIGVLLAHPASVSYGLNMQQGGHVIVWFSTTWNLEQYQQANARLHRQGQSVPVRIYHIVVKDSIDQVVMSALYGKNTIQEGLLKELKRLRK